MLFRSINFDQAIPHKKVLASLERFAKYVMPEFTEEKMAERAKKAPNKAPKTDGGPEAPPMAT